MSEMAMADKQDYVALEWVKGEIAETLRQAAQSLEDYAQAGEDSSGLQFCLTYIHQVQRTLQMVEFFGAALLAEEMELLAQALLDERVANVNEALSVLMQAILQLPQYLEGIQEARRDLPMIILPLLNDLRAARGEALVSQTSLFNPHMPEPGPLLSEQGLQKLNTPQLDSLLRKIRQMLQLSLIGLLRGQDTQKNLSMLARVFAGMEKLTAEAPSLPLWQAAAGLVDGLANRSLELSISVRSLLQQLDMQLRELVKTKAQGINQPAPPELLKNLLFYIAKAQPNSPRLQALHADYRLAEALPEEDMQGSGLADRSTMGSVVNALCEELTRVKDSLDLFVRGDRSKLQELASLQAPMKQIADTLAVLGFGQQRKIIVEQAGIIEGIASGINTASDAVLMDVAGALLYVEASLHGIAGNQLSASASQENQLPTDVAQVHRLVIREARTGLEQAKDGIIEFIASQWQQEHLQQVPELLNQVRGGLAMIPLKRAASLVNGCSRYIQEQLLQPGVTPGWQALDNLADAMTGVEYYLERLYDDQTADNSQLLDTASQSLAALGYAPEGLEATDAPESITEQLAAEPAEEEDAFAVPEYSLEDLAADAALDGEDFGLTSAQQADIEQPDLAPQVIEPDELSLEDAVEDQPADLENLIEELPEIELPAEVEPPIESIEPEPAALLASPANPLNPPASSVLPHLLPPPPDEEPFDAELQEIFVEEAAEVLETLDTYFPRWRQDQDDAEALTEVRRAFHTLKGSGRMVRALVVGELAWSVENLLNRVLEGGVPANAAVLQLVADVIQLTPELVDEYAQQAQRQRDDVDFLAATAHALARNEALPELASAPADTEAEAELQQEAATTQLDATPDGPEATELDEQLVEIFQVEALSHLDVLRDFLAALAQAESASRPVSEELQRAMHTLKGSAHMADIQPVAVLASAVEKLVKEYRAHLLEVGAQEAELLTQAHQLLVNGIDQLRDSPQAELAGSKQLVEALQSCLAQAVAQRAAEEATTSRDPLQITRFLAGDMDALLEMDLQVLHWQDQAPSQEDLRQLLAELAELQDGAEMAELQPLAELAAQLSSIYQQVLERRELQPQELELLAQAHAGLLAMLDEVAAGLEVSPCIELSQQLQSLLDSGAVAPQEVSTDAVVDSEPDPEAEQPADSTAWPEKTGPAIGTCPQVSELDGSVELPLEELDDEMVEIFLEEAFDLLESASQGLEQWLQTPDNSSTLTALMRDLHTLKGGARMAGIGPVGDLAHELESVYEGLLDGRYAQSAELGAVLQQAQDYLYSQLEALQQRQSIPVGEALIAQLHAFRQGDSLATEQKAPAAHAAEPPAEQSQLGVPQPLVQPDLVARPSEPELEEQAQLDEADDLEIDPELAEIFLEEADEILEAASQDLQQWLDDRDNLQPLESLQRGLHTLKGGARMAEVKSIGDLAHELEYLFEDLVQGRQEASDNGLETFLFHCLDELALMLDEFRASYRAAPREALVEQLAQWRQQGGALELSADTAAETEQSQHLPELDAEPVAFSQPAEAEQQLAPEQGAKLPELSLKPLQTAVPVDQAAAGSQEQVRISADLLEELVNLAGETSIFRGRVEQQVSDFGHTLHEMETTLDRIRDQLRRLDTETQTQILSRNQASTDSEQDAEFDPLEMDRHSQLQQLSRSLFEAASDLLDLKETLAARSRDAETLLLQQARVNTELQEGLMRTRMVPFERMVPRLRRIVRQVSGELGKQVELQVANAEGEMDRSVLERMIAPLEHMLRNAVGHGIELPEVRQAAGKAARGRISLELSREGADVLLTMSDDGAGINVDAVRNKAVERGLMSADSELSPQEVMQFILHSGFSTAEQVTQVSGRGVGMDVVSSEIRQLGGSINIESEPGQGTRFVVRLPFTVSVNRALMVMTGEDLYAIPLNTIEGIVRVSAVELEALYELAQEQGGAAQFEYAGQQYDLSYLGDLLGNGQQPKLVGQVLPLPVLLVRSSEHAVAVQVDSLSGSREIVVKSLGAQFASVPSLSGATILGDGRVVVILDLLAAIRQQYARGMQSQDAQRLGQDAKASQQMLKVMVVDDSVTVRKVTSRLLERHGMQVMTAKDGVEAINLLQEYQPDLMLLDIEMPRMDGFEVAALVRHDAQLQSLPIIMITSRTGSKHRERALALGVNAYLGKPYQEAQLLETIRQVVPGVDV